MIYFFEMMDVASYLSRIRYSGSIDPTKVVLADLQCAHLMNIPFENLDIHLSRPICLDPDALFKKIVTLHRGGFCYELNGLFALLLETLGYRVERLSASSANDDGSYLAEFDHLILRVFTPAIPEESWLVDVGWGDGPCLPLEFENFSEQIQHGRVYRLRPDRDYLVLEEKLVNGDWIMHYRFNRRPHTLLEFEGMCKYHQTSPDSLFTRKRLATIFQPEGRMTLSDNRLIMTRGIGLRGSAEKIERDLDGELEVRQALLEIFGIEI